MSNILTDILGFFKRKKFVDRAKDDDVVVLGIHEQPKMLGVASPIPYKDARLIKVVDLMRDPCEIVNWPLDGTDPGVFLGKEIDPNDPSTCYYAFRRLRSISLNLSITENGDFLEFDTLGEPNKAENVITTDVGQVGQIGLFKDKLGETLRFRSIYSSDGSIALQLSTDENAVDIRCTLDCANVGSGAEVYKEKDIASQKFLFRTLISSDDSLSIKQEEDEIDIVSNIVGDNVGQGIEVYRDKTTQPSPFNTLNFRTLKSSDSTVTINLDGNDEIDFTVKDPPVVIPWSINGLARDVGNTSGGFHYHTQVIWSSGNDQAPGAGQSSFGAGYIIPYRVTVTEILIKWRMKATVGISVGDDVTWKLGKLTYPQSSPPAGASTTTLDTDEATVNFTDSGFSLTGLTLSSADNKSWPYKSHVLSEAAVGVGYVLDKGDILVLMHMKPLNDWISIDSDFEVTLLGVVGDLPIHTLPTIDPEEPAS